MRDSGSRLSWRMVPTEQPIVQEAATAEPHDQDSPSENKEVVLREVLDGESVGSDDLTEEETTVTLSTAEVTEVIIKEPLINYTKI